MDKAGIRQPDSGAGERTGKGRGFRAFGFHGFRHAFISRLANADVPADVRKTVAGHPSDEAHGRYVHLDVSTQRRAIDKLPEGGPGFDEQGGATGWKMLVGLSILRRIRLSNDDKHNVDAPDLQAAGLVGATIDVLSVRRVVRTVVFAQKGGQTHPRAAGRANGIDVVLPVAFADKASVWPSGDQPCPKDNPRLVW